MTLYNFSKVVTENSTGILSIVQGVNNELMFGWFGSIFLFGLAIVMLSSFLYLTNDFKKSAIASSFITFIFCIFFKLFGIVPDLAVFICLLGSAGIVGFSYLAGKDE